MFGTKCVSKNNSLPVSRYCIVETGKARQKLAAVDRPSARGQFAHSECSSVSSVTSYHGGARCSIVSKIDVSFAGSSISVIKNVDYLLSACLRMCGGVIGTIVDNLN